MTKDDLKVRTKKFAVSCVLFVQKLESSITVDVISKQIIKSASSTAANYRASCRAKSNADFVYKLKVVEEEIDETLFWLEFIEDLNLLCNLNELKSLKQEANELVAIFTASIKTLKGKNKY